jgi:hypothetical protein
MISMQEILKRVKEDFTDYNITLITISPGKLVTYFLESECDYASIFGLSSRNARNKSGRQR